jgi:hypothetical protein
MQMELFCASNPSARVLYLHNKGSTVPVRHLPSFVPVTMWRHFMEHFLVTRHRDCLYAMDELGYDTCGVNLLWEPKLRRHFYSGNFW